MWMIFLTLRSKMKIIVICTTQFCSKINKSNITNHGQKIKKKIRRQGCMWTTRGIRTPSKTYFMTHSLSKVRKNYTNLNTKCILYLCFIQWLYWAMSLLFILEVRKLDEIQQSVWWTCYDWIPTLYEWEPTDVLRHW